MGGLAVHWLVQHRSLGTLDEGWTEGGFCLFVLCTHLFVFDLTAVAGCRHLPVSQVMLVMVYDGMVFRDEGSKRAGLG